MKKIRLVGMVLLFFILSTVSYAWTYIIKSDNSNIVFSFESRPHMRQVRHHTSSSYAPYRTIRVSKGDRIIVRRGQWLEVYRNNSWVLLSDADNR